MTLRVFINSEVSIVINLEHEVFVPFFAGRGEINLCLYRIQIYSQNLLEGFIRGFFTGGLLNPNDTAAPIIRSGTALEINGRYFRVPINTPVTAMAPGADQRTQIVFLYAEAQATSVTFLLSHIPPFHDPLRRGWYAGQRRALFKMVFIRDSPNQFVAKTSLYDGFVHFDSYVVNNPALSAFPLSHWSLSGAGNPPPQTITLQAGIYIFELAGAGGGHGGSSNYVNRNATRIPGGRGGRGGFIAELVILTEDTTFTAFTGQGGLTGQSGNLAFPRPPLGYSESTSQHFRNREPRKSGAGGGGGSGTFIFSANGYLLTAGGGGGGGGAVVYQLGTQAAGFNAVGSTAAGGGAGGSLGGGGAGGNTAAFSGSVTDMIWTGEPGRYTNWTFNISPAFGGTGGGFGGGTPLPIASASGQRGSLLGPANSFGFAGNSPLGSPAAGAGGQAAFSNFTAAAQRWQNTNNANGQGGRYGENGQDGGNNRNSTRGGGVSAGVSGSITFRQIAVF